MPALSFAAHSARLRDDVNSNQQQPRFLRPTGCSSTTSPGSHFQHVGISSSVSSRIMKHSVSSISVTPCSSCTERRVRTDVVFHYWLNFAFGGVRPVLYRSVIPDQNQALVVVYRVDRFRIDDLNQLASNSRKLPRWVKPESTRSSLFAWFKFSYQPARGYSPIADAWQPLVDRVKQTPDPCLTAIIQHQALNAA